MDERVIGSHQHVTEYWPEPARGYKGKIYPVMKCGECDLESEYEAEFLDKPCTKKA